MILTEAEARKKECVNWTSVDQERWNGTCLASNCMAWRWVPDKDGETMKQVGGEFFEVGYCGLAGKPQGVA